VIKHASQSKGTTFVSSLHGGATILLFRNMSKADDFATYKKVEVHAKNSTF